MDVTVATKNLSHQAVMAMLAGSVKKADEIDQPQCIVVVDAGGVPLGELRMTGAKYLSRKSARAKARTAASIGAPSHAIPESVRAAIAAATGGDVTGLTGGLPILIDGVLLGGIGIGSGAPAQDLAVANAGLAAIGAQEFTSD